MAQLLPVFFFLLLTLSAPWFWQLTRDSYWLSFLTIFTCLFLFLFLKKSKRILKIFLTLSFVGLFFLQIKETPRRDLSSLDNDQQRIVQMRTREYRLVSIGLLNKRFSLPIGYWLEGSPASIGFSRIKESFFELLDPNLYFFGSHPRERVGADEFEKLPLLFLPFLALGLLEEIRRRPKWFYWSFFILPVFFLSFWGNRSPLGPFSLLPFLMINIFDGFNYLVRKYFANDKKK